MESAVVMKHPLRIHTLPPRHSNTHTQRSKTMGAHMIVEQAPGATAKQAFENAQARAIAEFGNDPYNGTVSTFDGFEQLKVDSTIEGKVRVQAVLALVGLPTEQEEAKFEAMGFSTDEINRVGQKWDKAGMMKIDGDKFLIWGWAAS